MAYASVFSYRTAQEHAEREKEKREREAQAERDRAAETFRAQAQSRTDSLTKRLNGAQADGFANDARLRVQQLTQNRDAGLFGREARQGIQSLSTRLNEANADAFARSNEERIGALRSRLGSVGGGFDTAGGVPITDKTVAARMRRATGGRVALSDVHVTTPTPTPPTPPVTFESLFRARNVPQEADTPYPFKEGVQALARGVVGPAPAPPRRRTISPVSQGTEQFVEQAEDVVAGAVGTAFSSVVPPEFWEEVEKIPIAGETLRRQGEFWTSPGGIAILAGSVAMQGAAQTALELAGETGAGALGRLLETEMGAPSGTRSAFEVAGGVGAGVAGARGATRAARGLIPEQDISAARRALDDLRAGRRGPVAGAADDPSVGATDKLRAAGQQAPEAWIENERLAGAAFGERSTKAATLRDELISQGVPEQEAILKSTAELRGEMPFKAATGIDFTKAEEAWFWDQIITKAQYGEQANVAEYMQKMVRQVGAGEGVKDFPPFIWGIINRTFGEDFATQMQTAVRGRAKAINALSDAERMALPTRPFTGSRAEYPPIYGQVDKETGKRIWGPEGVPLEPGVSARTPTPGEVGATDQLRLSLAGEPRGAPGAPVPGEGGARAGTLREAGEAFPPPGITAKELEDIGDPLWLDYLADGLGLPRAVMASMDLSVGRQISKTAGRHPLLTASSMKRSAQAAVSQKRAIKWMDELASEGVDTDGFMVHLRADDGGVREIGLGEVLKDRYMAVPGTPGFAQSEIMRRPEFFISRLASKTPGLRQSGRAFAVGWNTQLQGVSRDIIKRVMSANKGVIAKKQLDAALNLTERLLGVGELGSNWFSKTLKALGFAPGYRISGPEAFLHLLSRDKTIRRIAADELFTWALLGNTILGAAKFGVGATVVTTLGSSQFGRIKFPGSDSYYNIWGTDNVLARAVLQAITQQKVDTKGNVRVVGSGEGGLKGFASALADVGQQYLKSGEDPIASLITEVATGSTYIGEELDWDLPSLKRVILDRTPMILQEFWDINATDGPLQTLLSAPGIVTGFTGVTSYKPTSDEFKTIPRYETGLEETRELIPNAPEALNLSANEQYQYGRYLWKGRGFDAWLQDMEIKLGPRPEGVREEDALRQWATEEGIKGRDWNAILFLYRAERKPELTNPRWIEFFILNEDEIGERFSGVRTLAVMDAARQRAREAGVIQ